MPFDNQRKDYLIYIRCSISNAKSDGLKRKGLTTKKIKNYIEHERTVYAVESEFAKETI